MFRKQSYFLILLSVLLAACITGAEPAADPLATTTPAQTAAAITTPVPLTETPSPPPTAETTTIPVPITPTPYTALPTNTPTPTPQSFYEGVWISGLLITHTELQVGNSSIGNVLHHYQYVPLQTADTVTAEQLNSLPTDKVLVMAEGDFYYTGPEDYWLVIKSIEMLNLPYSAETPLDATYQHTNPDFSFDYPAGWFIRPLEDETEGILELSNTPSFVYEQSLYVAITYFDPTQYDLTVQAPEVASIEAYIAAYEGYDSNYWDAEMLELNGRPMAKVSVYDLNPTVSYLVEVNGTLLAFTDWLPQTEFIERIVSTVR